MTRDAKKDELMTIGQAADYLGIKLRTLLYFRHVLKGGPKPVFLTKRQMRFKKEVLDDWKKQYLSGRGV